MTAALWFLGSAAVLAVYAALVALATHTPGHRASLELRGGRDPIYQAVCLQHGVDPLTDYKQGQP